MPPEQQVNGPERVREANGQAPGQPDAAQHAQELIDGAARLLEPLARRFGMGPGAPLHGQVELVRVDPVKQLETALENIQAQVRDIVAAQGNAREIPQALGKQLIDAAQQYRALPAEDQQRLIGFDADGRPLPSRRFGQPGQPGITLRIDDFDIMGDAQPDIGEGMRVARFGRVGGPVNVVPPAPQQQQQQAPAGGRNAVVQVANVMVAGARAVTRGIQQAINAANPLRQRNRLP